METSATSAELSFSLPRNISSVLHVHLTFFGGAMMGHLTTTTIGESAGSLAPFGSFVYAMPDRINTRSAISTPLQTAGSSIDYATRLAKILAIKTKLPVYIGCSIDLAGTTSEEEMEGLTKIVGEIMTAFQSWSDQSK